MSILGYRQCAPCTAIRTCALICSLRIAGVSWNSHRTETPNSLSKPNENSPVAENGNLKPKTKTSNTRTKQPRASTSGRRGLILSHRRGCQHPCPQPKRKSNCWKSRVAKSKRRSKAKQSKAKQRKSKPILNENQSHHPSPTNKPRPKTALISPRAPTYQQLISTLCSFCASAASSSYLLNPSSTSSSIPSKSSSLPAA
jgi:hypothetical protein